MVAMLGQRFESKQEVWLESGGVQGKQLGGGCKVRGVVGKQGGGWKASRQSGWKVRGLVGSQVWKVVGKLGEWLESRNNSWVIR